MYVGDFALIMHNVRHWDTECLYWLPPGVIEAGCPAKTCDVTRVKNYECPVYLTGARRVDMYFVQSPSEDPADCRSAELNALPNSPVPSILPSLTRLTEPLSYSVCKCT